MEGKSTYKLSGSVALRTLLCSHDSGFIPYGYQIWDIESLPCWRHANFLSNTSLLNAARYSLNASLAGKEIHLIDQYCKKGIAALILKLVGSSIKGNHAGVAIQHRLVNYCYLPERLSPLLWRYAYSRCVLNWFTTIPEASLPESSFTATLPDASVYRKSCY
jgi:hypothetical protein